MKNRLFILVLGFIMVMALGYGFINKSYAKPESAAMKCSCCIEHKCDCCKQCIENCKQGCVNCEQCCKDCKMNCEKCEQCCTKDAKACENCGRKSKITNAASLFRTNAVHTINPKNKL